MQAIAIIGAGFSGTATAAQLLRRHGDLPLDILLINRHPGLGRGVAYGTHSPAHLLNVPAGRMSLYPDDDDDFLRYARTREAEITGGSFVHRGLYGDYLAARLEEAARKATRATLSSRTAEVTGLHLGAEGGRLRLTLADDSSLDVDRVVLASGNPPPADPPLVDAGFFADPAYVRDPWAPGALDAVDPGRPVLLIGTGLTMLDVGLELVRRGFPDHLFALSRRGLTPQAHRPKPGAPLEPRVVMDLLRNGPANIRRYLKVIRLCVAELGEQGIDWRDVIAALRPFTAELWQRLAPAERGRFLRHVQAYWDTHRHRTAPEPHGEFQRLQRDGTLVVKAGRLTALTRIGASRIQVCWRPRRSARDAQTEVGTVINCTGPQSRIQSLHDPLFQSLLRQGLLVPDPLGLGVQADAVGALLDRAGKPSKALFYSGPLLKARDWECTAVPELRLAALRLADRLADDLRGQATQVA